MSTQNQASSEPDSFRSLPKVELHRHLEGSLRLSTLRELSRNYDLQVKDTRDLAQQVQVNPGEELTIINFLMKFSNLRRFYRSQEIIERLTLEAIEDAAEDNVRYMELRFTPVALARAENFNLADVIDWVVGSARLGQEMFQVITRLIVSINRHEDLASAQHVVQLAAERLDQGIVGLDMAGNEALVSGRKFWGLMRYAREAGLGLTVHAGEWGGPQNVRDAILDLEANRIGHGIRVLEDPAVVALARERNIPFEVCLTSNYQTGAVASADIHPVKKMLAAGLNVTLNTDDPGISQVSLSDEYRLAFETKLIPVENLRSIILSGAAGGFLPEIEKSQLIYNLHQRLADIKF